MDPVLNRQMFQGGPRPPQGPGDKGIVGLVDDEAPAKAMQAVAGSVDKFEAGVDGAQDYEQLMNAVRGNEQPIDARYAELAKVVGEEDARATPESVLAVAQPALELLSGKGIQALTGVAGMGAQQPQPPVQGFAQGGPVTDDGYMPVREHTGYDQDYEQYSMRLNKILGPPKNLDAEVASRKALFDPDDSSSFDANMALMKYGSQVANTPGGILTALTKPAGEFSEGLTKIANKKADVSRAIKSGALDAVTDSEKVRMGAHVGALKDSFNSFQEDRRLAMRLNADKKNSENAMKAVTVIMDDGTERPATQRGTMLIDPNTQLPLTGIKRIKDDTNGPGVKESQFMIQDASKPAGVRPVTGFMLPDGRLGFWENGQQNFVDNSQMMPGKYDDFVKQEPNFDGRGNTRFTATQGPKTGTSWVQDSKGNIIGQKESLVREDLDPAVKPAAAANAAAFAQHTPEAQKALSVGAFDLKGPEASFLVAKPPSYTKGIENMTKEEQNKFREGIAKNEALIRATDELVKVMPDAVGMWPTAKSFVGNATGSLGLKVWVDPKNEAARTMIQTYVKTVQEAIALNPRFAVSEQDFIKELAGNPQAFFRDPELAIARVRELARQAMNDMEVNRAALEGRAPLELQHIPQGTEREPFDLRNPQHKAYLKAKQAQGGVNGLFVRGIDDKLYPVGGQ
jgi:hypothetical protein